MGLRKRTELSDFNCFFITTTCHDWLTLLYNDEIISKLYHSLDFVNKKFKAHLVGYVFMPNHIHLIVYFEEQNQLANYMRDFKKFTSGEIRRIIEKDGNADLLNKIRFEHRKQKFKIWMDRFDDLYINTRKTMLTKLIYIHQNPVKKGLADYPWDYRHSSAGYYLKEQIPLIRLLDFREIT